MVVSKRIGVFLVVLFCEGIFVFITFLLIDEEDVVVIDLLENWVWWKGGRLKWYNFSFFVDRLIELYCIFGGSWVVAKSDQGVFSISFYSLFIMEGLSIGWILFFIEVMFLSGLMLLQRLVLIVNFIEFVVLEVEISNGHELGLTEETAFRVLSVLG